MSQLEAVEREISSLEEKLRQARDALGVAEQNVLGAEATYDAAVRDHYDGKVSDAELEQARAARIALGDEPDRLRRIIVLLEERIEAQRPKLDAEQLQEATRLGEAASREISALFLRILEKRAEVDSLQTEMYAIGARAKARAKSLGNHEPPVRVDFEALKKEWVEKRDRQGAAAD
jgi:hypothetical protein